MGSLVEEFELNRGGRKGNSCHISFRSCGMMGSLVKEFVLQQLYRAYLMNYGDDLVDVQRYAYHPDCLVECDHVTYADLPRRRTPFFLFVYKAYCYRSFLTYAPQSCYINFFHLEDTFIN